MIKTMMTGFATVAALTMIAGSAQAAGSRSAGDETPPARTAPAAQPAQAAPAASPKQYCIVDTITGSRIQHKVCKTREAWMRDENFDPLNP